MYACMYTYLRTYVCMDELGGYSLVVVVIIIIMKVVIVVIVVIVVVVVSKALYILKEF